MAGKTAVRIVIVAIVMILAAGAACVGLITCGSNSPLEGARASALNAVIDQTGIKQKVQDELYDHLGTLAERTGLPVSVVEAGIEALDIVNWEATTLPSDAVQTGSFSTTYNGQDIKVTSYKDTSLVTVDAYGQSVTFKIPESAQIYTEAAPLISDAQDIGLLSSLLGEKA